MLYAILVLIILALVGITVWLGTEKHSRESAISVADRKVQQQLNAHAKALADAQETNSKLRNSEAALRERLVPLEQQLNAHAKALADAQETNSKLRNSEAALREKLAPLIGNVERQERLRSEIENFENHRQAVVLNVENARELLAKLSEDIDKAKAMSELAEQGAFRRVFTYEDPASYQDALQAIWSEQDRMLKGKTAAVCSISWEVHGSKKEGEQMVGNLIKLAIRAFNGEADSAIARVKWNNRASMEEKIRKSEEAVEKMLKKWGITIADSYRNLKLKELKLTFEKSDMDKKIQDEQREIRALQREEERAIRDAEQARRKAEQEESRLETALNEAKAEMGVAHTEDLTKHMEKIRELEGRLAAAEEMRKRAISQAELTKLGHIYITSNIGSFGDGIFKIGMTRRLDPMDRIWELSDASVPFDFDVHGMIRTDDAPALERKIHAVFAEKRINLVNQRKEFFQVSIHEIQAVCEKEGFDIRLTLAAEAREWHETKANRERRTAQG